MQLNSKISFCLALLLGAGIWILSPVITGYREPWSFNGIYYLLSLGVVGIICGFLNPRHLWTNLLGIFLGQLIYITCLYIQEVVTGYKGGANLFFPVGLLFLVVHTLFSIIGIFLGSSLNRKA